MDKKQVVEALEMIATYLELKGENTFKVAAYRRAAQALERDERSLKELDDPGKLKGIGKGTSQVIQELRETGKSSLLESLQAEIPAGLMDILALPGIGSKKVATLYKKLGITDVESLREACEQGKIRTLPGFGVKTEEKLKEALEEHGSRSERLPISFMLEVAEKVEQSLRHVEGIIKMSRAGSLRRMEETLKDLDYVLAVTNPDIVREQLIKMDIVHDVIADGQTKVTVELESGYKIQVDFRLVSEEQFATTLHHFTGSKEHNVQMRQLAKAQGEKISEYGVENESGEVITFPSEEAFFHHFGLKFIPPEARMGMKETEVFQTSYPLVSIQDIRGDFHMHTTWSDGAVSIEEMVESARKKGYEWIAITDHSKFLQVANGLNEERLLRQIEEIRRINDLYDDIHVFAGIEMDILPDATLDFSDEILAQLDVVIASIHSSFSQSQDQIHARLETALQNPYVHLIAHPTGRIIGRREGYDVDVDYLLKRAKETNTAVELNANPNRLDLSATWLQKASELGVNIAVNTDAHRPETLDHMEIGVSIARKALLKKEQLLNTFTYEDFKKFLQKKRRKEDSYE